MENEEVEVSRNSHALKSAAILGGIGIIIGLLVYIINIGLMANMWFGIIMLIFSTTVVTIFGRNYRKLIGGYLSFGKSYVYSIMVFAVAGIIGTLFNILLFEVIDPDAVSIIVEAQIENSEKMMRNIGAPDAAIEESIDEMRETIPDNYTAFGQVKGYLILLIFYAVLSLISGAIIKKNEPISDM